MALFPTIYSIGSPDVAGIETMDASIGATGEHKVTLGFKPRKILVALLNTSLNQMHSVSWYDEDVSTTNINLYLKGASTNPASVALGGTYRLKSVDDDGFTFEGAVADMNTIFYAAIK